MPRPARNPSASAAALIAIKMKSRQRPMGLPVGQTKGNSSSIPRAARKSAVANPSVKRL